MKDSKKGSIVSLTIVGDNDAPKENTSVKNVKFRAFQLERVKRTDEKGEVVKEKGKVVYDETEKVSFDYSFERSIPIDEKTDIHQLNDIVGGMLATEMINYTKTAKLINQNDRPKLNSPFYVEIQSEIVNVSNQNDRLFRGMKLKIEPKSRGRFLETMDLLMQHCTSETSYKTLSQLKLDAANEAAKLKALNEVVK